MNKRNYQKELENHLAELERQVPKPSLLLHSCCAPCSSYVLEYLRQYFFITVFYYNPNIYPPEEYRERKKEQERLIQEMNASAPEAGQIRFAAGEYCPESFFLAARGLEKEPEGGRRCTECFRLRLLETAQKAREGGFDYFTTTLTISPLKDAERLNQLGEMAAATFGVPFLNSDFKKKNGYRRSLELSKEYGLYRQNYCGCIFSRREELSISSVLP